MSDTHDRHDAFGFVLLDDEHNLIKVQQKGELDSKFK